MREVIINSMKFTISDDEIKINDFFTDEGTSEEHIYQLLSEDNARDAGDYFLHNLDIEVITFNPSDYEWNKEMSNYKKIIL